MNFRKSDFFPGKSQFSPDLVFEGEGFCFLYTYIRKNASTSFKRLFQTVYPGVCSGELPSIGCMSKRAKIKRLTPEEVDRRFGTKVFVYRDPVDRVFSVFKNKLIQQDGAEDLLRRLEKVVGRDPALLTFDEFVNEYVALLRTERWDEVDGHLYPQVWHLLPITYNKVVRMDSVYQAMRELLPIEVCDQVFKEPSNSTTKGSVPLPVADAESPASYLRDMYSRTKALPKLKQLLTTSTEARLREIYMDDYRMISEVEKQNVTVLDQLLHYHSLKVIDPTLLQFGFNDLSLQLARNLKEAGHGRLFCVVTSSTNTDALYSKVAEYDLTSFLSVVPANMVNWPYLYPVEGNTPSKLWFQSGVLESLPELDWVIVDGPDWQGDTFSRYPTLPFVIDRLAPGAEVWMLGADDSKVRGVVNLWCENYPVSVESVANGQAYRIWVK